MDSPLIALVIVVTLSSFATMGSLMAYRKRRDPIEGLFLGLLLGPIGIAIEAILLRWIRPEVDQRAWQSFRMMLSYQTRSSRTGHSRHGGRSSRRERPKDDLLGRSARSRRCSSRSCL